MNNTILKAVLLATSATSGLVNAASIDGLWTGQSFNLKSSGVIKKGQAIDNASAIPKQVNAADIKVKFNCYLQFGKYDDVTLKYDYVTTCQGKNGWEITDWASGVFYDLVDHGLGLSHYDSNPAWLGLTTTDGTSWDGDTHWGNSGTYVYFSGQYIFTPKLANAVIKTATFFTPTAGLIGYDLWTPNSDISGVYKANMSAKFSTGKIATGAAACLATFVSAQGNGVIKAPCDPIN